MLFYQPQKNQPVIGWLFRFLSGSQNIGLHLHSQKFLILPKHVEYVPERNNSHQFAFVQYRHMSGLLRFHQLHTVHNVAERRYEIIPTSRPSSSTGKAPICLSRNSRAASTINVPGLTVWTLSPSECALFNN